MTGKRTKKGRSTPKSGREMKASTQKKTAGSESAVKEGTKGLGTETERDRDSERNCADGNGETDRHSKDSACVRNAGADATMSSEVGDRRENENRIEKNEPYIEGRPSGCHLIGNRGRLFRSEHRRILCGGAF